MVECLGCGCSLVRCLDYRLNGQVCCPECSHRTAHERTFDAWIIREAQAIAGPRTHLQDVDAVIEFGRRVALAARADEKG